MAISLYDITAPSRRQRERLKGLYATQEKAAEDPTQAQGLYPDEASGAIDATAGNPGHHGKDYGSMSATELNDAAKAAASGNIIERNMASIAGMLGPLGSGLAFNALDRSLMGAALNNAGLPNPSDFIDGKVTGGAMTSMNLSPEMMGKSDPSQSIKDDLLDISPESPGLYSKGGKVTKEALIKGNPPGPDNVIIGAKTGERIITSKMFDGFSAETRAEIEAALKKAKRK